MKIRMETLASGPGGSMHPGREYDVDDATGKGLVDGRYAVEVKGEPASPPVDIASAPAPVETGGAADAWTNTATEALEEKEPPKTAYTIAGDAAFAKAIAEGKDPEEAGKIAREAAAEASKAAATIPAAISDTK